MVLKMVMFINVVNIYIGFFLRLEEFNIFSVLEIEDFGILVNWLI